jgi:site-specific DNA recombinase
MVAARAGRFAACFRPQCWCRKGHAVGVDERIAALQVQAKEADDRLRRLYKLVEDGIAEMDDTLKDRMTALKAKRGTASAAADRARGAYRPAVAIRPAKIEAFGKVMRGCLTTGDIPFRKACFGAIIDPVEVDEAVIRILGRNDVLEAAVASGSAPGAPVRSLVCSWRAGFQLGSGPWPGFRPRQSVRVGWPTGSPRRVL